MMFSDAQRLPHQAEESAASPATTRFLDHLFPPPRDYAIALWNGQRMGEQRNPRFTLWFKKPGTLRRMFRPPLEINFAECFMRGEFDVTGDMEASFATMEHIGRVSQSPGKLLGTLKQYLALPRDAGVPDIQTAAQLSGRVHERTRASAAIQYHYDVGNTFYAQFLDRRMVYTCAYFADENEDLEVAQLRKLDVICRKLNLQRGERMLDIGCGWGGLLIYAAENYGVHGVGVTLSRQQHLLATERVRALGLQHLVEIRLQDYRDVPDTGFDKVASICMYEAVGLDNLPTFLGVAYNRLKPGGLFLNQGICYGPGLEKFPRPAPTALARWLKRHVLGFEQFRDKYIFPDGALPYLSALNLQAEHAGFEVRDVESMREHYILTLRHWRRRLEQNSARAIAETNELTYRTWRLYLAGSCSSFITGATSVFQTLFCKPTAGKSGLSLMRPSRT